MILQSLVLETAFQVGESFLPTHHPHSHGSQSITPFSEQKKSQFPIVSRCCLTVSLCSNLIHHNDDDHPDDRRLKDEELERFDVDAEKVIDVLEKDIGSFN